MYSAQVSFADEVLASVMNGTSTMNMDDDMDDMDNIEYSAETLHQRGPSRGDGSQMRGDQSRITMDDSNSLLDGLDPMESMISHSSDSDSEISASGSPLSVSFDVITDDHNPADSVTPIPVNRQTDSMSMVISALNGHGKGQGVVDLMESPVPSPPPLGGATALKHQYSRSALQGDSHTLPISVMREKRRKSAQRSDRRKSGVLPNPMLPTPRLQFSKSKSANTPRHSVSKSTKSGTATTMTTRTGTMYTRETVSSSRRSIDGSMTLPLNSLVKSQTEHKQKKRKKTKNFKYRSRESLSDSRSSQSSAGALVTRSISARESSPRDVMRGKSRKGSLSRTRYKQYSSKLDKYERRKEREKAKKVSSLSSKHFAKKPSIGGGLFVDGSELMAMDIPAHLRTYYRYICVWRYI